MHGEKFQSWLLEQLDRDDAIGDLASDFKRDSKVPSDSSSYDGWSAFFASKFSHAALEAFEEAWAEFSEAS